jgi:hypothetical protein
VCTCKPFDVNKHHMVPDMQISQPPAGADKLACYEYLNSTRHETSATSSRPATRITLIGSSPGRSGPDTLHGPSDSLAVLEAYGD